MTASLDLICLYYQISKRSVDIKRKRREHIF